jgi:hypothetical protein
LWLWWLWWCVNPFPSSLRRPRLLRTTTVRCCCCLRATLFLPLLFAAACLPACLRCLPACAAGLRCRPACAACLSDFLPACLPALPACVRPRRQECRQAALKICVGRHARTHAGTHVRQSHTCTTRACVRYSVVCCTVCLGVRACVRFARIYVCRTD